MPTARCTSCSKRFYYRNTRGNKLSYHKCECGGEYEALGGNYCVSGKNPFQPESTFTSQYRIGEFYYAEANRKKELFYPHEGYYKPIPNAVLAAEAVPAKSNGA